MLSNIKNFFSYNYLIATPSEPINYSLYIYILLALLVIGSLLLKLYLGRKVLPVFYKRFLRRISDAFLYMPIAVALFVAVRNTGIEGVSARLYLDLVLLIWLIWLGFLVYFRLVEIPVLWQEYKKKKREERYINHG